MAKFTSSVSKGAGALLNWFDDRLPVSKFWNATMAGYMAPKNFNFWYYMGSLALLVLVRSSLS
jgi:ubiquinol-cytochrome c reductase cytochrome b subunit